MSRRRRGRKSGTRRRPQKAAETLRTDRLRMSESDLVDKQGEPYPPLIRKLMMQVLSGESLEMKDRLARLNEELDHCIRVCESGRVPTNLESVLLKVWETVESLDETLS